MANLPLHVNFWGHNLPYPFIFEAYHAKNPYPFIFVPQKEYPGIVYNSVSLQIRASQNKQNLKISDTIIKHSSRNLTVEIPEA